MTGSIDITCGDYDEAVSIYNAFSCQILGDHHDIYLETDVFLLAAIFEKFRKVCMNVYKLDPSHFYSAPNLIWDAMHISTEAKFFERSICGGVNGVREIRQPGPTMLSDYDRNEVTTLGGFFDVTSCTQETMPRCDYIWNSKITLQEILKKPEDSTEGVFLLKST